MSKFSASAVGADDPVVCTGPCCGVSRRGFLASFAAAGAATALPTSSFAQTTPAPKRRVIDVHHHYFPDVFKQSSAREGPLPPFVRDWSPQRMIEEMDKNNIEKSVLSLASVPVGWFRMTPDELRPIIRTCNEYAAKLVQDNKGRHGLFAYVSCKDVDGSLQEIAYAYDTLKADGIEMSTSFGDKWPGDPAFTPVFEELNRRKAIVYFHPLAPFCCGNLVSGVQDSWIEYPYDSGRAILSLLFNGTLAKFRDIRWIFSHSGGAIPYLSHRVDYQSRPLKNLKEVAPDGVLNEFRRLHYETANAASGPAIAGLLKLVPISQVMYGSDFPYVTSEYNLANLRGNGLSDADMTAIEYGNAEKLIPALKS
ncbi:amidohydrolase family protein [Methylocella sp. CPCC 101449]|jgi:predicted TIM-barrel fold metal-dependent hydrolase|uniref:amidohydrolase family protein n=1 Tax=Methylocella sp. CPCC 101449 TaxID=2987531 RepID=UPI0028905553|nr:amidohydrolase family protein [Methylocella sp. CPCC 101449]MDT2019818.1 amidohydrolase [Methylocella sp. CPCC 101449]HEV2575276.1 amidohydrolase family protein [Beijerinckiaceae bacterium]